MPHSSPRMNISAQMIRVEEMIRIPDWRRASPKKRNTRRPHTSRTMLPVNPAISPVEAIRSRGIASSSFIAARGLSRRTRSLDHEDLRVGGEEHLGEYVVEREDRQERDDDRLVDGAADALGAAGGGL